MSHYNDKNPISDKAWMQSVLNQMKLKTEDFDTLDAKVDLHDRLRQVLSNSANAIKPDDLNSMKILLSQLSVVLTKISPQSSKKEISDLYKDVVQKEKYNQQPQAAQPTAPYSPLPPERPYTGKFNGSWSSWIVNKMAGK